MNPASRSLIGLLGSLEAACMLGRAVGALIGQLLHVRGE
jgi:hypothetical protein